MEANGSGSYKRVSKSRLKSELLSLLAVSIQPSPNMREPCGGNVKSTLYALPSLLKSASVMLHAVVGFKWNTCQS